MKSEPFFSEAPTVSITPSQVLEYLFCPRFIFFMECLKIPQHEELRFKVQMGREVHQRKVKMNQNLTMSSFEFITEVHQRKVKMNPEYLRKKIGVVKKEVSVYLASKRYKVRGIVDEVLTLSDGTMAPLEYKFAEYRPYLFKTHKTQLALQSLLIQENYGKEVKKGFLIYTRSKNLLREISFRPADFDFAIRTVEEILRIIQTGYYPAKTKSQAKCPDCCYKNICV